MNESASAATAAVAPASAAPKIQRSVRAIYPACALPDDTLAKLAIVCDRCIRLRLGAQWRPSRGKSAPAVERHRVDDRATRWERRFSLPVIVAALATIPLLILDESRPGQPWRGIVDVGDWVVWLVFAAELVTMLSLVRSRRQYLLDHPLEVAIVVLTPPFLSLAVQSIRIARVLRVLRVLRLGPVVRRMLALEALRYAALLALLALVGGAEAYASAERISVGDALFCCNDTTTTVGYGDITPKTVEGKVIACVL